MKKLILAGAVTMLLLAGSAAYAHPPKHPNLADAHELVVKAMEKIGQAQKENPKGDLGGHAQKAKDLLTQAEAEIKAAITEADTTEAKDKK